MEQFCKKLIMKIKIFYEEIESFALQENIQDWIDSAIQNENLQTGEINIIFCSDEYLLKMNKEHLKHDFYTDIITFDYCENSIVSGDLFISKQRVEENAREFATSFRNEINRVVIHGILHLIGYKDKTNEQQKEISTKEDFYLSKLHV